MQTNKLTNRIPWALALLVALGMGLLLQSLTARADTITVTSPLDSGPGTLRQAIADAAPGDQITFAPALDGQTITLSSPLIISEALTIDGSSLSTPVTVSGGDAVRVFHVYTDTHVTLDGLTIAHGRTTIPEYGSHPAGGGIKIEPGAVVTLTHSAVVSNTATYYDAGWGEYYGHGGGVYNLGTLAVIETTFVDNVASSRTGYVNGDGGAIHNRGTLTVTGSTLTGNAAESGGGIYNRSGATLAVESSTLSNNSAPCGGSGISNRGTATVSDSTISDNVVPGEWCEAGAAGISNDGATMTVTHSIVSGNVNGNGSGGGLSNYGDNPDQGRLTVVDSTIYSNTAGYYGGGIYNWWDSALTVTNSRIYSNTAGYYGGGILSGPHANTAVTVINSTLSHNAAQDGGGLYNGSPGYSGAVMTVINSTLAGNTAIGSGGGLYNWDSASVTLANTIVWGSGAPAGPQVSNSSANRPTISSSDIQGCGGSGAGWDPGLGTDGGGNIDQDPLCVDAAGGDLHLQLTSPAIDAGDNGAVPVGVTADLDGHPRFADVPSVPDTGLGEAPIMDMGAYEVGPALLLHKAVAPAGAVPCHGVVTYTLSLENDGTLEDTVLLTDTLPAGVTFGGWIAQPAGMIHQGGTITWAGTLAGGASITAVFTATHTGGCGYAITNTAYFSGTTQSGSAEAAFYVAPLIRLYLPLVSR
jgi:hypothetical protein